MAERARVGKARHCTGDNMHTSMYERSRIIAALAVVVVIACAGLHGQSASKQPPDLALAALGGGFVSATAQVNGTTLHYVDGGAGPAIILLHGFPQDWYEFHQIMPRLAKQFTVIAVDLRGVGGSAASAGGYDAANMAKDIHQLAEQSAFAARVRCRSRYRWNGGLCLRPPLSGNQPRGDDA